MIVQVKFIILGHRSKIRVTGGKCSYFGWKWKWNWENQIRKCAWKPDLN